MPTLAPEVETLRAQMTDEERQIFDRLVAIAHEVDPAIQNSFRWKQPTFTLHDNWHHWLFSINRTKKGVTLNFHKGWLLDDPENVLRGDGAHMRQIVFKTQADIEQNMVAGLMREAIKHQTDID
ncbi:MAG: hypothetical protein BroJett038_13660 [Chloroflexota bacterium]|nr:MAG: hypothetical protein BroJett038_13660 [Chloroflexota bacterium]